MRTQTLPPDDTTPPRRTIRRVSLPLNQGKWAALREMAHCYRGEKNTHLRHYNQDARFAAEDSDRAHRDQLVQAGYVSPHELQARMWKMALKDGYATVERQWAALATDLKPRIARHETWSETAKHYAYWLIYTPCRMAELTSAQADPVQRTGARTASGAQLSAARDPAQAGRAARRQSRPLDGV